MNHQVIDKRLRSWAKTISMDTLNSLSKRFRADGHKSRGKNEFYSASEILREINQEKNNYRNVKMRT